SAEEHSWNRVKPCVLGRVCWALEHIQHAFGDHEASCNIDRCEQDGKGAESLGYSSWEVATAHDEDTTNADHTRDGVGHTHKRRVQGRSNSPDDTVTDQTG
nr:hypothetical protein [Tanacetum cinerariifolium]